MQRLMLGRDTDRHGNDNDGTTSANNGRNASNGRVLPSCSSLSHFGFSILARSIMAAPVCLGEHPAFTDADRDKHSKRRKHVSTC